MSLDVPQIDTAQWCETCGCWITQANAVDHPNGLGGHWLSRWVVTASHEPPSTDGPEGSS